ncbi:hypothetical protein [Parvicella tangerina]|nr:hypothetical protein [Parvicella tangerina]
MKKELIVEMKLGQIISLIFIVLTVSCSPNVEQPEVEESSGCVDEIETQDFLKSDTICLHSKNCFKVMFKDSFGLSYLFIPEYSERAIYSSIQVSKEQIPAGLYASGQDFIMLQLSFDYFERYDLDQEQIEFLAKGIKLAPDYVEGELIRYGIYEKDELTFIMNNEDDDTLPSGTYISRYTFVDDSTFLKLIASSYRVNSVQDTSYLMKMLDNINVKRIK